MKIAFSCRCGQRLQVREENRGKRVRCPSCNAIVPVPEANPSNIEVYSLTTAPDGMPSGGEIADLERSGASVREISPQHTARSDSDRTFDGAPDPGTAVSSSPAEDEGIQASQPCPLANGSPPEFIPPPPLPEESGSQRQATRPAIRDSRIRRLASRTLTIVGWLCIAVAGLQFSVFAGSIAWSFKCGRDVAAHEERVREVQNRINALDERILRKLAGPVGQRRPADDEVDTPGDVRPVQPPHPRMVDRDEEAGAKLRDELFRLRMSKPSEFTLSAAFAMATGFAALLFWLAATSGLISGSLGCLLLRLTSR